MFLLLSHNRAHKHTRYIIYCEFCLWLLSVNLIFPSFTPNVALSRLMTLLLVLIIAEPSTSSLVAIKMQISKFKIRFVIAQKCWVWLQNLRAVSLFKCLPLVDRTNGFRYVQFFQSLAKQIPRLSAIKWVFKPAIWESWSNLHDCGSLKLSESC